MTFQNPKQIEEQFRNKNILTTDVDPATGHRGLSTHSDNVYIDYLSATSYYPFTVFGIWFLFIYELLFENKVPGLPSFNEVEPIFLAFASSIPKYQAFDAFNHLDCVVSQLNNLGLLDYNVSIRKANNGQYSGYKVFVNNDEMLFLGVVHVVQCKKIKKALVFIVTLFNINQCWKKCRGLCTMQKKRIFIAVMKYSIFNLLPKEAVVAMNFLQVFLKAKQLTFFNISTNHRAKS